MSATKVIMGTSINQSISWFGQIPRNWNLTPGSAIFAERKIKNIGLKETQVLSLSYGQIVVKPEEKLTGLVPESFETYQVLQPGDIVIRPTDLQNDKTSLRIGHSRHNGIITSAYIALKINSKNNSRYFFYLFFTLDITKAIYGLGSGLRQNLSFEDFKRLKFPVPTLQEQTAIANFLDQKTALIDKAIAIKERQIELLKERRQILIQQAVTKGLDPNVEMKDSGVEWIGKIPKHWKVRKLKYLGETQNGISREGNFFGSGYPFVGYSDVFRNIELPRHVEGLANSNTDERKVYSIKEGDVLFTRTSETIEEIGFSSVCFQTIVDSTFSGFLIRFRPNQLALLKEYSKFYFSSSIHRKFFIKEMNLVTRASLSQELLKKMPVLLPPIIEQKNIAQNLEEINQKFSLAIKLKEQEILTLKTLKSTLINSAVTGKIKVA